MSSVETAILSPCNRVCVVHPVRSICIGCGRSLDEIARWIELTAAERAQVMEQLPGRLAAMNAALARTAAMAGEDH